MLRSPVHSVSIRRWSRCGTACIRQRETADDGIACADHSTYGKRRCSILRKRGLLDSINTSTHAGLHDRALIGFMVYSFARIGAALGMVAWDVYTQTRRRSVRLHEKGGKCHGCRAITTSRSIYGLSRRRGPARRSQGASVPHNRSRHRQAYPHGAAAGERISE
jgi:hypothetical protein